MESKEEQTKIQVEQPAIGTNASWFIRADSQTILKRNKSKIPCGRWGHGCTFTDKEIYVYGGDGDGDKKSSQYWDCPYRLDLETWKWKKIESNNQAPGRRDSHSVNFYKDRLLVFGGSFREKNKNNLYEFDLNTNLWRIVDVKGAPPSEREGHSACLYNDRYLIIYGGCLGMDVMKDAHILDLQTNTWAKLEPKNDVDPSSRESHSCSLINGSMYIFGGQDLMKKDDGEVTEVFKNDLVKLNIVFEGDVAGAMWERLEPEGSIAPHRSSHSSAVYKNRYMFIIGGEGYSPEYYKSLENADPEKPVSPKKESDDAWYPKSDVWFYDININKWSCLKVPNEAEFIPRFAHSCVCFKENLVVFGGLNIDKDSMNDLCILALNGVNPFEEPEAVQKPKVEKKPVQVEVSKKTTLISRSIRGGKPDVSELTSPSFVAPSILAEKMEEQKVPEITELEGPVVSMSFLHSFSSLLTWPLAAFGLLLDNALINKATKMRIETLSVKAKPVEGSMVVEDTKRGSEMTYLVIEDDGKGWKHEDFVKVVMNYDTDVPEVNSTILEENAANPQEEERKRRMNEYAYNLKIAGFRLGRTLIYISRTEDQISLGLMSVDKRFNPDVHDNVIFLYSWKVETQEFLTSQGQKNKDIILNALSGLFTEEDLLYNIDKVSNRLYILDLNPVPLAKGPASKSQDYELQFVKKGGSTVHDIMVRSLDKNFSTLYQEKQNLPVELSLSSYFGHFFLDPSQANIEISINDNPVQLVNVKEIVESQDGQSKLKEVGLYEGYIFDGCKKESKDLSSVGNKRKTRAQNTQSSEKKFNQGILIYHENRLIRRLENSKLGDLDFLSTQTRKYMAMSQTPNSFFDNHGYIEVKSFLKPNKFKTEIENTYYSNFLYCDLISKIEDCKSLNQKRVGDDENIEEFDVVRKKVKQSPKPSPSPVQEDEKGN